MGSQKEFEGRNVEDALNKASMALNIDAQQLDYEVVNEGASGIFGLVGAKKAKITVTFPPEPEEPTAVVEASVEPDPETIDPVPAESDDPSPLDVAIENGSAFLTAIAENITQEISIESTVTSQKVKLNLGGANPAMLIGRRGETLEALQYLTEKVTNKGLSKRIRVQLDVEGYMQNRRDNIRNLSLRLAEKAKRKKRPVTVGQMPPHERRLVHVSLRDEPGVRTQSVGAGFIRKIMIFPENGPPPRRRKPRSRRPR